MPGAPRTGPGGVQIRGNQTARCAAPAPSATQGRRFIRGQFQAELVPALWACLLERIGLGSAVEAAHAVVRKTEPPQGGFKKAHGRSADSLSACGSMFSLDPRADEPSALLLESTLAAPEANSIMFTESFSDRFQGPQFALALGGCPFGAPAGRDNSGAATAARGRPDSRRGSFGSPRSARPRLRARRPSASGRSRPGEFPQ